VFVVLLRVAREARKAAVGSQEFRSVRATKSEAFTNERIKEQVGEPLQGEITEIVSPPFVRYAQRVCVIEVGDEELIGA